MTLRDTGYRRYEAHLQNFFEIKLCSVYFSLPHLTPPLLRARFSDKIEKAEQNELGCDPTSLVAPTPLLNSGSPPHPRKPDPPACLSPRTRCPPSRRAALFYATGAAYHWDSPWSQVLLLSSGKSPFRFPGREREVPPPHAA